MMDRTLKYLILVAAFGLLSAGTACSDGSYGSTAPWRVAPGGQGPYMNVNAVTCVDLSVSEGNQETGGTLGAPYTHPTNRSASVSQSASFAKSDETTPADITRESYTLDTTNVNNMILMAQLKDEPIAFTPPLTTDDTAPQPTIEDLDTCINDVLDEFDTCGRTCRKPWGRSAWIMTKYPMTRAPTTNDVVIVPLDDCKQLRAATCIIVD